MVISSFLRCFKELGKHKRTLAAILALLTVVGSIESITPETAGFNIRISPRETLSFYGSETWYPFGNPEHFPGSLNGWSTGFVGIVDSDNIINEYYEYRSYDMSGSGGSWEFHAEGASDTPPSAYAYLMRGFDLDSALPYSTYNGYVNLTDASLTTDYYIYSTEFENDPSHLFIYFYIIDDAGERYKFWGDGYGSGSDDTPPNGGYWEIAYDPSQGGASPDVLYNDLEEHFVRTGPGGGPGDTQWQPLEVFLNTHSTSTHYFQIAYRVYVALDDTLMTIGDWIEVNIDDIKLQIVYSYDDAAPTTSFSFSGTGRSNGWYRSNVEVTLSATDNASTNPVSGVENTYYRIEWSSAQRYTGAFTISDEGIHVIEYWSVDNAGNIEIHSYTSATIDRISPAFSSPVPGQPPGWSTSQTVDIGCTIRDAVSGVNASSIYYRISTDGAMDSEPWQQHTGAYHGNSITVIHSVNFGVDGANLLFQWRARDLAGNDFAVSPVWSVRINTTDDGYNIPNYPVELLFLTVVAGVGAAIGIWVVVKKRTE